MDNTSNFEAYVLLTLPTATLRTPFGPIIGPLALEYVSHDRAPPPGFLLLIRVAAYETVLDPSFAIRSSFSPSGDSSYVLRGTGDADDLVLTIPPPHEKAADDLETLHSVLTEYGARPDVKDSKDGSSLPGSSSSSSPSTTKIFTDSSEPVHDPDLRGRFVLVNEESHDVVGALDSSVRVREDPVIYERGHERDPVVVELPEGVDELAETEVMVRAIPPEDRGWMVNGAMFASHVISGTTTLLTSAMGAASSLYVSRATPSPHANPSSSSSSLTSKDPSTPPTAPPSRTMLLLQSPTTRKNLTRIHTLTGHAVTLSSKAAGMVNDTIDRAVGAKKGKGKSPLLPPRTMPGNLTPTMEDGKPPLPRRSVSPAPPAYYPADDKRGALYPPDDKPALPPRRSPLPSPSHSPIPLPSSSIPSTPPTPGIKPTTKARVALSAALIFASLSTNTQRLVTAGGDALSAAVTHKYGADAGDSVRMATVSARNVVLVYVDVKGMGRKAVVKRAVKGYAKGVVRKDVRG